MESKYVNSRQIAISLLRELRDIESEVDDKRLIAFAATEDARVVWEAHQHLLMSNITWPERDYIQWLIVVPALERIPEYSRLALNDPLQLARPMRWLIADWTELTIAQRSTWLASTIGQVVSQRMKIGIAERMKTRSRYILDNLKGEEFELSSPLVDAAITVSLYDSTVAKSNVEISIRNASSKAYREMVENWSASFETPATTALDEAREQVKKWLSSELTPDDEFDLLTAKRISPRAFRHVLLEMMETSESVRVSIAQSVGIIINQEQSEGAEVFSPLISRLIRHTQPNK